MGIINNLKEKLMYKHPWEKYYPKGKRNVKIPNMSLYEFLRTSNKDNLSSVALNYFGKKITYEELLVDINICAKSLRSQGIRPGDVVSICLPNTPESVISFYAINKIGAIANMIHPLSAQEEIKQSIVATKSVILITVNFTYSAIKNIIDETEVYKVVLVSARDSMPKMMSIGYYLLEDYKVETPSKSEKYLSWKNFMSRGSNYKGSVLVKTTKDQPCCILHSGGTTGVPKNILLTNGNINVVVEQAKVMLPELDNSDKMLSILPMFHCFGLVECIHFPLCLGATAILIPKFDASRFDKLLTKYRPTILPGVPTLFEALIKNKHMRNIDLSEIKYVVSGGDSLSPDKNAAVNKFLKEHNCHHHIIQGYGMTETSGGVIFGGLGSDELGSVGIPLPGNEVKIVSIDTREEVPAGEVGEIMLAGPTVMLGYLDNEKETNEVLEKDKKGKIWVHTGDLGYLNENGVLFFVQRLKRMLIVSGYNVYPSHIEEVLMNHPYVLNCGVIGIPHPYKVQVPKAFIVLNEDIKLNSKVKDEIKEYCKKNLAKYMIPKEFVYRESLPKTLIGKVNYRELEKDNEKKEL